MCLSVPLCVLSPSLTFLPPFPSSYTALKQVGLPASLTHRVHCTVLCLWPAWCPFCPVKWHTSDRQIQHTHSPSAVVSLREPYSSFKAQSVTHFHVGGRGPLTRLLCLGLLFFLRGIITALPPRTVVGIDENTCQGDFSRFEYWSHPLFLLSTQDLCLLVKIYTNASSYHMSQGVDSWQYPLDF